MWPRINQRTIVTLAIFDLDDTLLCGDSDHAWGLYLAERCLVNAKTYVEQTEWFLNAYKNGRLDIQEFLNFQLRPFKDHDKQVLLDVREQFIQTKIQPMISPKALALVERHRSLGRTLVILTSTNEFITRPIADKFGIDILIATELEVIDGNYTGQVSGVPSFREGKVTRLKEWMAKNNESLAGSWFYSDSHNDLPLLEIVDNPVAVNPDALLMQQAKKHGWEIIDSMY